MNELCFLDMDGVLANFVAGVCEVHNRPDPYLLPDYKGIFELYEIWEMSPADFWKPLSKEGFWTNLAKMPDADQIVEVVCRKFGAENVCILTSPSLDSRSVPEKRIWCRRHYPQLASNILFGSAKHFLAGPGRVLIDDRDENICEFCEFGGSGILVPRPWNALWWLEPRVTALEHVETMIRKREE